MKKLLQKSLLALFLMAAAGVSNAQTYYFQENFSSGSLPSGWTNDSLGQPGVIVWLFNNPYTRVITGAGFDANFAMFDSDAGGVNDNTDENASLTTPSIDISAATGNLFLELDEQYRALGGPNSAGSGHWIETSVDGGTNWSNLVYDSANVGYPNPAVHTSYDLSAYIGNANILIRFHWTGSWDWWWAIDNVVVVSFPACVAAPNAGTANASVGGQACDGVDFTLSLTGASSGPLVTYQWQSSSDNLNWFDIAGATSVNAVVAQSSATYYHCNVTCSGFTATSNSLYVDMNPPSTCYCAATHIVTCTGTGAITNVDITGTTLNNPSVCDELTALAYTFWPPAGVTTANLTRGSAYDFNVTTDNNNIISIWIDYDANGIFDPTEWVQVSTTSVSGTPNTVNWMVPSGAIVGPTWMRVRARLSGNPNGSGDACLSFGSGESEDYIIGIEFNVGVNEMTQINGVSFFPNPTAGKLSIFFHDNSSGTTIQMYDPLGNLVKSSKVENALRADIDISDLSNGAYFAKVTNGKETVTQKIILNK